MILAALVYIRKVTSTTTVSEVTDDYLQEGHAHILQQKGIPPASRSSASKARFCSAPRTRSRQLPAAFPFCLPS
jgi:hypothetical protein